MVDRHFPLWYALVLMKAAVKDTHIYFPVKVLEGIKKLAALNRRTVSAEIVIAVERHVAQAKDYAKAGGGK